MAAAPSLFEAETTSVTEETGVGENASRAAATRSVTTEESLISDAQVGFVIGLGGVLILAGLFFPRISGFKGFGIEITLGVTDEEVRKILQAVEAEVDAGRVSREELPAVVDDAVHRALAKKDEINRETLDRVFTGVWRPETEDKSTDRLFLNTIWDRAYLPGTGANRLNPNLSNAMLYKAVREAIQANLPISADDDADGEPPRTDNEQ